jgi:hypothetical protein
MDAPPHVIARVLPELARTERDRTCHVFPIPADEPAPATLRAYCGFEIAPGQAERLDSPGGMPCVVCLLIVAVAS